MKLEYGDPVGGTIDTMKSFVTTYGEEIDKQLDMNKNATVEQLADEIWNQVNNPEPLTLIEELKKNSFQLSTGRVEEDIILNQSVITRDGSFTDGTSTAIIPYRPAGVSLPGYPTSIVPLLNTVVVDKGRLSYVYQSKQTTAAGVRLENVILPQGDREFTEADVKATSIGGYMSVTKESMEDMDSLNNELRNGLYRDTELILSNQIINGNGTPPNMDGLLNQATPFAAGVFALKVPTPTFLDVLKTAGAMILNAGYQPTLAIVSPNDFTTMNFGFNAMQSANFQVYPTSQMPDDKYLILSGPLVTLYVTAQQMKIWEQNADNAINNRVTITTSLQAMLKLAPNNIDGVITGNFLADQTAITAP